VPRGAKHWGKTPSKRSPEPAEITHPPPSLFPPRTLVSVRPLLGASLPAVRTRFQGCLRPQSIGRYPSIPWPRHPTAPTGPENAAPFHSSWGRRIPGGADYRGPFRHLFPGDVDGGEIERSVRSGLNRHFSILAPGPPGGEASAGTAGTSRGRPRGGFSISGDASADLLPVRPRNGVQTFRLPYRAQFLGGLAIP
jgi:hypothetical protein